MNTTIAPADIDLVLIHGAWHGGWIWNPLLPALQQYNFHSIHAPTLIGMGETSGIYQLHPRPVVGLQAHVQQIIDYIRLNDLQHPYLVGHSYAGAVLSGVLAQQVPITGALFLDAIFFMPGREHFANLIQITNAPPWLKKWNNAILGQVLRNRPIPKPPVQFMGIDDPTAAAWVDAHMSVLPAKRGDSRITYPTPAGVPLSYVRCTGGEPVMRDVMEPYARFAQDHQWAYHELATGHECMLSMPGETASLIHEATREVVHV